METLNNISYGMYCITTKYAGKNVGCIVNTVMQITAENPKIAVSINKENYTNKAIKETKRFVINILSEETKKEVIGKFGFFSSKEIDKFGEFKSIEEEGLPKLLENMCGYITCKLESIIDCDTHEIFIASVEKTCLENNWIPMTYRYYKEEIKGTSPKNAPTYAEKKETTGQKYKCIICGHIYDEEETGVKFEDLPDSWRCPICGVGKDKFVRI